MTIYHDKKTSFVAIEKAEYLPFRFVIITDHQGIILYLKWSNFTTNKRNTPERAGRTFKSTYVNPETTYRREITNFLLSNNLLKPLRQLPENPLGRAR